MDWPTIVHSTTSHFLKQVENNIMRERKLLALMQSKGRVSFNEYGKNLDWKVRYKRAALQGFMDGDTLTFARNERFKTATLDWRSYALTSMQSKMERLKNRSTAQIIDLYAGETEWMLEDIEEHFADELYGDGTSSTRKLHGIETFLSQSGAVASSVVRAPSATYGGLSCVLGTYGGTWSGTWPDGKGDSHYDFWSPILVDYTSANWGGSTHTWTTHGVSAIRFGIIKSRKSKAKKGMMDMILITDEMYRELEDVLDDKEQINVNRGEKSALVSLGFTDTINIDGCDVTWEYGMAEDTGYGFNVNQMELMSMQDRLFKVTGPVFNEETQSYRFMIDFYGNARFNPRSFVKLLNYS